MSEVERSRTGAAEPSRTLLGAVLAVTAMSAGGAAVSVRDGLSETWLDALGPDGRLSIPLPMTALQLGAAVAAGSTRRRVALTGSALLAGTSAIAVASGAFDGGYADDRLTGDQRAVQLTLVTGIAVVGALATVRFVQVRRSC